MCGTDQTVTLAQKNQGGTGGCRPACAQAMEYMQVVPCIKSFENMTDVIDKLRSERATAAPVVDETGHCVGILTDSDVEKYESLRERVRNGDYTALDAVFDTDEFGLRRIHMQSFDLVARHMTCPAITVEAKCSVCAARRTLGQHPIHHLVVVDGDGRPLGMIDAAKLPGEKQRA